MGSDDRPAIDVARIRAVVADARAAAACAPTLLEPDGRAILEAIGVQVPRAAFVGLDDAVGVRHAVSALPSCPRGSSSRSMSITSRGWAARC